MAATGRNIDQLVKLGIVERQENPDDRRVKLVSLSPTGFEVADQQIEQKRRAVRRFVERLSTTEAENLTQALRPILAGESLRTSTKDLPCPVEAPEYPEKIDTAVLKVAGVVVLGAIMSILDITVVNVALPTFQQEFATAQLLDHSLVAWTVTAYTLALATVIPLTGWAADRFGTKRLYITALALFTVGSALCATAWDINSLIGFRVLQGLGGGMLMPLGMTIMTRAAGPDRMGRLMAILGIPMLLGPIMGPILGGWLIDTASWHWIFLINLPLGIAAIVYALHRPAEGQPGAERVLRLPRHAAHVARPGAVPVRHLLASRVRARLHGHHGCWVPACHRPRPDDRVRVPLVPPGAPAARPAAVQGPQPDRLDHHHVPVRRRVLRRPAAGADVLPGGPRESPC